MFARAQSEYQIKRMDAALSLLQSTLKLKNDFVPAYVLFATIYRAKNDITKAGYYYEQAFNYETDINKKIYYKMFAIQAAIRECNWTEAYQKAADTHGIAPDNEMVALHALPIKSANTKKQLMLLLQ